MLEEHDRHQGPQCLSDARIRRPQDLTHRQTALVLDIGIGIVVVVSLVPLSGGEVVLCYEGRKYYVNPGTRSGTEKGGQRRR